MVMGHCESCGLVQMIEPAPANELIPRVSWITYNEPEGHLDTLAQVIYDLPGVNEDSTVCGISFKDDSLVARLEGLGVKNAWRIETEQDLGISEPGAGIETIQDKLTNEAAGQIAKNRGLADVVIVRHIFEHAHDTLNFAESIKMLAKPNGYIVIEVPDCTKSLESHDYSCPWEEHVLYFTPETYKRSFALAGMTLVTYISYPYSLEDSLVAILRPGANAQSVNQPKTVSTEERDRISDYAMAFKQHKDEFKSYLSKFHRDHGKIALLGAGHIACTFINLLQLKDHFEFIVDDNHNKRGLFLPGSGLPIVGSDSLISEDIKLCLLTVHPQMEERVIKNNKSFTEHGGTFASIFPRSKLALKASTA